MKRLAKSDKKDKKAFAQTFEKLNEFLHDFNAVVIENALADGTITKTDVARELLNIPYDIDLEKLRTENVVQVGNELVEVFSKVSEGCATAGNPCEGLDVVRKGIVFLRSITNQTGKSGEVFALDIPLAHAVWLSAVPAEVGNYKKMLNDILHSFEISKNYQNLTTAERDAVHQLYSYKDTFRIPISLLENAAVIHRDASLKKEKLEDEINKVLTLKAISLDLKNDKSRKEFNEKLKSILMIAEHCASILSDASVNRLIRNMHSFVVMNSLRLLNIKERNITHGFFNGPQNYVEYFDNLDSGSSENSVLLNSPRESLKNYLVHSSALSKEIKPYLEVFETEKSLSLAEENIKEVLMEAKTEIAQIAEIQKYGGCYQEIHEFDMPNGFDLWENEKTHVQNLGNNGAVLAEKLSEIPKGLPLFEKFADDLPSLSPSGIVKKIESYPEKYQIIAEVKIRLGELEGLTPELDQVKSYAEETKIKDLFASTSTWFENSGANRIFNCLENTTVIGALGNVSWARSKFVLSELKPDNKYLQEFKESEISVQSKIDEWEKLSNNIKMELRNQGAASNRPKLKNPFLVNRDLSYAVKLFHDLVAADNMDYSALTNSEIEIDAIIRNMTDRALRSNLITLFDSDTRKTLRSLPSIIAQIEKQIVDVPKDKQGFLNLFKNIEIEGLSDVKIGELTDMLMLAGLPLNQNVTEEIKYTELEFSNGSTELANGLKAFLLAHTFLSAVLSPEDKAAIDSQDSSGYYFQWWHAVVAVLGAVVITILIRFIYFYAENKGEKNQFEKALTDTFSLKQKKKGIEIMELASGETGSYITNSDLTKEDGNV